jgi:hypothetical protein
VLAREGNPAATLALDLEFVLPRHFLVRCACCAVRGSLRQRSLHLLAKEEVIEVHCESPGDWRHAPDTAVVREPPMSELEFIRRFDFGHRLAD